MEILDSKTDADLHKALLAEIAKSHNEVRCAKADIEKASNRLNFALVILNTLINRTPTKGD